MDQSNEIKKLSAEEYALKADTEIAGMLRGGRYSELLDAISDLGKYTVRNVALIKEQYPDATNVTLMRQWNYRKRSILAGAKAIKILAPVFEKVDSADGGKGQKEKLAGYKINFVFDISQTRGEINPDMRLDSKITPTELDVFYENIQEAITGMSNGYGFSFVADNNLIDHNNKVINLKAGQSREDTLRAMIYGVACANIEGRQIENGIEISQGREMFNEIEQTAVAHIASKRLGLDGYKLKEIDFSEFDEESITKFSNNLNNIRSLSQRIINRVESCVMEIQSANNSAQENSDNELDETFGHAIKPQKDMALQQGAEM